ncbi:MAG: molybdopterin molybdotransferase MoeA [Euryarchaeota archaeon]|nr:molybdopterin molybdotransferase MoeA [Euryarchaeota archaeon]
MPLKEALERLERSIEPLPPQEVHISQAAGRVLAEDVRAERDNPPFSRAAMDGFAVRASSTFGASPSNPRYLRLKGEARAGAGWSGSVGEGEAVRVSTGAPLPAGADAVVMLEHVNVLGGEVEVLRAVPPGKNVALQGEDYRKGEVLLSSGTVLGAKEVAVLASLGRSRVRVAAKPRVRVIATGDELAEPGEELEEGRVYEATGYALLHLCRSAGAEAERAGIVEDRREALREAVRSAASEADVVLITGASSVGEHDLVPEVLQELGRIEVHGIAMRPGEPSGFGRLGRTLVFMLPGYPVATLFSFEALVRPALQLMQGAEPSCPYPAVRAVLRRKIASELGRRDFVRVRLERAGEGYEAEPVRVSGSGVLSSMLRAHGFTVVPENTEGVEKGESIEVRLFTPLQGACCGG